MEKEFVTYTQSLALKELGFDEPCFGYYDNGVFIFWYDSKQETELLLNCSAPLKQQVFRWFREKHDLFSEIQPYLIIGTQWRYTITNRNNSSGLPHKEQFKTYKEAESACIDKLIELVKNK